MIEKNENSKKIEKNKKKGFVNLDFDERVECIGDNT